MERIDPEVFLCSLCQERTPALHSWSVGMILWSVGMILIDIPEDAKAHVQEAYSHLHEYNTVCDDCLIETLLEYVAGLPIEELPLHINSSWGLPEVLEAYKERLATI